MNDIYFDNSATTQVSELAASAALQAMRLDYGNPSSAYSKGVAAFHALNEARATFAKLLNVDSDELYFTSCGTESNNTVIQGIAKTAGKKAKIIISAIEHPSVYEPVKQLAALGYTTELIPVSGDGIIDLAALGSMLDEQTALVSIMHVNNETGAIQPLSAAGELIRALAPQALFHIDAVQSFGRLPLNLAAWQADTLSLSGHKIHAPKGIGLLWLKKKWNLPPLLLGGGQERGFRSGTENMSSIIAFATAAAECYQQLDKHYAAIAAVKRALTDGLKEKNIDYALNSPDDTNCAAHILNISFPHIRSEVMLHSLEAKGLFVSAGSACTSQSSKGSRILTAMNLDPKHIDSALRFSFSRYNTVDEVKAAVDIIAQTIEELALVVKLYKAKKRK